MTEDDNIVLRDENGKYYCAGCSGPLRKFRKPKNIKSGMDKQLFEDNHVYHCKSCNREVFMSKKK